MELKKIAENLIKFRTETGNLSEINRCLEYVQGLFGNEICRTLYQKDKLAPVLLLSNHEGMNFDVLVVGHLDVVPAADNMFVPREENNKIYGRGTLDMKSFAAVGLNSLEYTVKQNLPLNFGVLLSTDEEKGSFGLDAFLQDNPQINAKVVLDVDVAGDITKIVAKCKNPVFVKIISKGLEAHGSTPWEGVDANEKMLQVLNNIRKLYPYFSKETKRPDNTWINTVHFAKIEGGEVANVISNSCEALLDFRLTENSSVTELEKKLSSCLVAGTEYKIITASHPVVMDEKNQYILQYKKIAENVINKNIEFEYIGGATDSRAFAEKGSVVVMHSGSGDGMHASGEYVEWDSVEQLAEIQKNFLKEFKA
ncbi:MAG: M20 family metallopeptidase [Azospirillum sp.]|nr:M20 family metallopeptidase [Azospirillum sp.]